MSKQRISKWTRRVDFTNREGEGVPKLRRGYSERLLKGRGSAGRNRKDRMPSHGTSTTIRVPMNLTGNIERRVGAENSVKKAACEEAQSLVCR